MEKQIYKIGIMKIKTIGIKYPQKRLVLDKVKGVEYCKIQNYINPFLKKFKRFEVYKPIFDFSVDGYHTVNTIMLTNKPWCCSFEDYVPRGGIKDFWDMAYHGRHVYNRRIDKMVEVISHSNCKRLIALSECNFNMQLKFYENYGHPELIDILAAKTCTLKVPQDILSDDIPQLTTNIKFVFVGNDFIRKGGREVLEVLKEIRKVRNNFELNLITNIETNKNYSFYGFQDSVDELDEIRDWARRQEWIHIYTNIPNDNVIEIIKRSNVGFLPTWFDTYGYSVLEMQACGVPVITTNVRALPEINKNGWIMEIPTNFNNEIIIDSISKKYDIRKTMQKQMYDIVLSILDNNNLITSKGKACLEYIAKFHSPYEYSQKVAEIYSEF